MEISLKTKYNNYDNEDGGLGILRELALASEYVFKQINKDCGTIEIIIKSDYYED